jgi:heavy metal-binding protein
MAGQLSSLWIAAVALVGCAATALEPLEPTHPASPLAAEAPLPPPSSLAAGHAAAERPPASARYTCPMHPDVHRSQPGRCPRCGMELVPDDAALGGHAD